MNLQGKSQVQIFCHNNYTRLRNHINTWLINHKVSIVQISYSSASSPGEKQTKDGLSTKVRYSAMVIFHDPELKQKP